MTWILVGVGFSIVVVLLFFAISKARSVTTRLFKSTTVLNRKEIFVDGFRISYVEAGSGRPILLIHGLGASLYCFRFLLPLLAKHFRVIALDLPGFGRSDKILGRKYDIESQAQRIVTLIEILKLAEPGLVGSSMGGLIAMKVAESHPGLIRYVVGLAPALLVPSLMPKGMILKGHEVFGPLLSRTSMRLILKRVLSRHELITDEMIEMCLEPFRHEHALKIFIAALQSVLDHSILNIKSLNFRLLILWGQEDRILPARFLGKIQKIFPDVATAIHPDGGHHLQEDDPVWVCRKIVEFSTLKS